MLAGRYSVALVMLVFAWNVVGTALKARRIHRATRGLFRTGLERQIESLG